MSEIKILKRAASILIADINDVEGVCIRPLDPEDISEESQIYDTIKFINLSTSVMQEN